MLLSNRKQDAILTKRLEQFIDSQYKRSNMFNYMERIKDKEMQVQGIDIVYDNGKEIKYIDEKFAIDYRGKELMTYSFELSSKNNPDEQGWFLDPNSLTTHYLLLWFNSDEEINTIYSYDACLISKEKIRQMLKRDGLDPKEALDQFNTYFESNTEGTLGMQYHVVVNPDGTYRRRMMYKGYTITQSTGKEEMPINILVRKEKLLANAEMVMHRRDTIDVDTEVATAKEVKVDLPKHVGSIVNTKSLAFLKSKNVVSGNLWLEFNDGVKKQMQIKNIPHKTKILMYDKVTKQYITVAVYDKQFGEWALVANGLDLKTIGKAKVIPYKSYMKNTIRAGYIPIGFEQMDKMHNRMSDTGPFVKENGNKIISTGEYTGGVRVNVEYDDVIKYFVLKENPYIGTQFLDQFGATKILTETERIITRYNNRRYRK